MKTLLLLGPKKQATVSDSSVTRVGVSASTVRTKLKKGDWTGTHQDQRLSGEDRGSGTRVVLGRVASLGSDKCRLRVSMKIEKSQIVLLKLFQSL